jgi:hypothetical protein
LERLVELDRRQPEAKNGPAALSPQELSEFAQLCYYKRQFRQAATFWRHALATEQSADGEARRYNAACAAALAGSGPRGDDSPLDAAEQAAWQRQAIEWLSAELAEFNPSWQAATRPPGRQRPRPWSNGKPTAIWPACATSRPCPPWPRTNRPPAGICGPLCRRFWPKQANHRWPRTCQFLPATRFFDIFLVVPRPEKLLL